MPPWMWQAVVEAGVLRRLHRHRRALAEGAVEHEALAGAAASSCSMPPAPILSCRVGIGRVQRAGDGAVLLALARLAQVDQRDVAAAEQRHRLVGADRPAAAARSPPGASPTLHVGGHRDVHHLRIGQVQIVHQRRHIRRPT